MMNEQNERSSQSENQENRPFESDVQKLMRRHMADPNHVITDEELEKVKVGMNPPPDAPTQQAIEDGEDRIADRKSIDEDDTLPGSQKVTPWDVINP